jgi:signal transduction histidine kinase/HPt (histidine-containing phosphotransfer) domain-containing protein
MESINTALLVEDNPGDARLLREMFDGQGLHETGLTCVESMGEAEKYLAEHPVDVILLDLELPDAQGVGAIRRAHAAAPLVPVVVLTGLDDDSLAAQAIGEGAQDYLVKGQIETRGLLRAMRYASERKHLERLKDEFVSTVSHELRTPLTSIYGSLCLLMGKAAGNLPEQAAHLIGIAHANCRRLVRLVNDILDVEKLESGKVTFNFRRIEVRPLIEEAIEANRGLAEVNGIRIILETENVVGDVRADSGRLLQVITNLLSNAIKFSPRDNEVVVRIEEENGVLRVSVRDHGPGIPAEFKPRIFERFARADDTDGRQHGGTGLGLSIVKQVVDRLNGNVGFADAPDGGTIFHFELPCWDRSESMVADLGAQPGAVRMLFCEDDLDTAIALRQQLRPLGFATDFAFTAAEAIARASETQYRAILMDLILPDRNGISVILRLRQLEQYRDTPIIVVSADPNRGRDDLRSSKLNVLDWLSKPVDYDRLMQLLPKPDACRVNGQRRTLLVDDHGAAHDLAEAAQADSIDSIEAMHRTREACDADFAVPETAPVTGSGADPSPELDGGMGHPIRVLHVDDDSDVRAIVAFSLGLDPAISVMSCASGSEALAIAADVTPDLILSDVMMSGMDGPALLVRLRDWASTANVPVIFMTAQCQTRRVEQLTSLGAIAVITKPFDPKRLAGMVRGHLHSLKIGTANYKFLQRLHSDAAALAVFRAELREEPGAAVVLKDLQSRVHKLAGAAGMFNFQAVSDAASALEDAIIERAAGPRTSRPVEAKLDELLECIEHERSIGPLKKMAATCFPRSPAFNKTKLDQI